MIRDQDINFLPFPLLTVHELNISLCDFRSKDLRVKW